MIVIQDVILVANMIHWTLVSWIYFRFVQIILTMMMMDWWIIQMMEGVRQETIIQKMVTIVSMLSI